GDCVLARMILGPGNAGLGGDALRRAADMLAARMQREFRQRRADGEETKLRAVLREFRIAIERARKGLSRESRPKAMPGDQHLVSGVRTDAVADTLREAVEPRAHIGAAVVRKVARENPVDQNMLRVPALPRPIKAADTAGDSDERKDRPLHQT